MDFLIYLFFGMDLFDAYYKSGQTDIILDIANLYFFRGLNLSGLRCIKYGQKLLEKGDE